MELNASDVLEATHAKWAQAYADAVKEIAHLTAYVRLLEKQLAEVKVAE